MDKQEPVIKLEATPVAPPDTPKKKPAGKGWFAWFDTIKVKIAAKAASRQSKSDQLKASVKPTEQEVIIPSKPDERAYNPFDWVVYVLRWSTLQTLIPMVAAVVVWGLVYAK